MRVLLSLLPVFRDGRRLRRGGPCRLSVRVRLGRPRECAARCPSRSDRGPVGPGPPTCRWS